MAAHRDPKRSDKSELELRFEAELPQIISTSFTDCERAIASIESYLANAEDIIFRKSLLSWEGRLLLENGRIAEAIQVLVEATRTESHGAFEHFNAEMDLARAYHMHGDHEKALQVLTDALKEFEDPGYLSDILQLYASMAPILDHRPPSAVEGALRRVVQHYGIQVQPISLDLHIELRAVCSLIREAAAVYNDLERSVRGEKDPYAGLVRLKRYIDATPNGHFRSIALQEYEAMSAGVTDYERYEKEVGSMGDEEGRRSAARTAARKLESSHLRRMLLAKFV